MSLKQNVITILEQNRGQAVSGQDLAERLGVSRAAVWKAVQFLKEEGWEIEAATKKGYCLRSSSDILSAEGFCAALGEHLADVTVLPKVDSTNTLAKKWPPMAAPMVLSLWQRSKRQAVAVWGGNFILRPKRGCI